MKSTVIAILVGSILVAGAIMLSQNGTESQEPISQNNVSFENGKQVVYITAKGGYSPRISKAKADLPTILKMETKGTFDCSAALSLPSVNYQNNLPPSGVTEIELPPQKAGTSFNGMCAMGMYRFQIDFE